MKTAWKLALIAALLVTPAAAQRHDPLTAAEADQIREASQDPARRLDLIVKFARVRLDALMQLRADPKAGADRAAKTHDLLEDFEAVIDELDDNIDDYSARNQDLRKPLKDVVDAETDFLAKLQTLKGAPDEKVYSFMLQDTIDAVSSSLDNAKSTLADQIAHKGELKKK
jgi:hypothetical protein